MSHFYHHVLSFLFLRGCFCESEDMGKQILI